jgi:ATP adenylyltransferase
MNEHMDRLWAPWRIRFIRNKKQKKCIFCQALKSKAKNYVLFKTRYSLALLNIFPYNNGHSMVSPIRHVGDIAKLSDVEALDLFSALTKVRKLLDKVLKPHGYNIGINISRSAGAGIVNHLHIHIVPRWIGDTNFISTVYGTKIISQSLDGLYKQLKHAESKTDQRI